MKDIKDYREKELKNYVIGNILILLFYSGMIQELFKWGTDNSIEIWGSVIESVLLSSIIYIYVFILDSLISGETKFKIGYLWIMKKPGYKIFSDMKRSFKDDRFSQEDVFYKYKDVYDNMPESNSGVYENTNWFRIYDKYKDEGKIFTSNRDYLLCRDLNVITLWMLVLYLIMALAFRVFVFSWTMLLFIIAELVITNIAMHVKGKRFVYNVISIDIYKKE